MHKGWNNRLIVHWRRLIMQNWFRNSKGTKFLIFKKEWGKILKLSTLKSSACLNMQQLREQHDEALNADKDNVTIETIEQIDKLIQVLE